LPWGPYSGPEELCAQIDAVRASGARPEYALIDLASGKPFGQASYLNIDTAAGSIEVGGIVYARAFQRGIAATEAMYLMMRRAFDELGYRRYAWQCNSLNARSQAAATRLGFTFEGIWRQANVHKGATVIPHGFPSSMANGRRSRLLSSAGSRLKTSTLKAISECAGRCSPPQPMPPDPPHD
jgi:RimJ/RimL family protein N-acetyltransferase